MVSNYSRYRASFAARMSAPATPEQHALIDLLGDAIEIEQVSALLAEDLNIYDYADQLHSLFCSGSHPDTPVSANTSSGACAYEEELDEDGDENWGAPQHSTWLRVAKQLDKMNLTLPLVEHLAPEVITLATSEQTTETDS